MYEYEQNTYFVGKKQKSNTKTIVELYKNDKKIATIFLRDEIKKNAQNMVNELKKQNIKTALLSGDSKEIVENVAKITNFDEYCFEMLPQDKFNWLEKRKSTKEKIGFVGDGLNDAPSLTLSDVGFCMGLKGTPSSIEASDIIIANDNLEKISMAIKISKYTRKIVWENIIFSAIVKITFLTLGAIGVTGMLSAVIADVGVTVLAILNSLRALFHNVK